MADDTTPPQPDAAFVGPRKRPAPTIDLTATEVPSAGVDTPSPSDETARADASSLPDAALATADADARFGDAPPPPPESPADPAPASGASPWRSYGAGAAGGAGVALAALLLWAVMPARDPASSLDPRLTAIEAQLRGVAAKEATSPAEVKALTDTLKAAGGAMDALNARIAKLEGEAAKPAAEPDSARRLTALEAQIRSTNETMTAIAKRSDASAAALGQLQDVTRDKAADHTQMEALAGRVAALEKTDRAIHDELAQRATAAAQDRAVRLAIATNLLRAAVERSEPFQAELIAIRPLVADGSALHALEPFAEEGVPSAATLGRELGLILPAMMKLAGSTGRDGGFIDRLQANAEKLIRVRPVDEPSGDSAHAILSRVDIRAAHADIPSALGELNKLPERVRAPAKSWVARAEARGRALEASRRLASDSVSALKPSR